MADLGKNTLAKSEYFIRTAIEALLIINEASWATQEGWIDISKPIAKDVTCTIKA